MKDILREGKLVFISTILISILFFTLYYIFSINTLLYFSIISLILFLYTLFFLRKPVRKIKIDENVIYSSADGYIIKIEENVEVPYYINDKYNKVVIFMHVASMHWNLAPISGKIEFLKYQKGKFKAALASSSWKENEHMAICINNNGIKVLMIMIAGLIARRIKFFKKELDNIQQGEILGLIKYGSANTLYIPKTFKIKIKEGQRVRAGKTVIAIKE
ncbi:MAG TPA: phosphatidylserine decarboxylase [Spirochaetota bacterium]|nr:phosphatidylserine decarboxylase [Spirochaetota bacterium]HOM38906.1 phosphatidylserine decarboxylase [Spirochaetota bacterium]HPQ49115.1 phosphatidylserine decarboxylase [Spirochaetota bacterium]